MHSTRGQATFVGKLTAGLAITFMLTSLLLTYDTAKNAKSSVIDKVTQEQVEQGTDNNGAAGSTEASGSTNTSE